MAFSAAKVQALAFHGRFLMHLAYFLEVPQCTFSGNKQVYYTDFGFRSQRASLGKLGYKMVMVKEH